MYPPLLLDVNYFIIPLSGQLDKKRHDYLKMSQNAPNIPFWDLSPPIAQKQAKKFC